MGSLAPEGGLNRLDAYSLAANVLTTKQAMDADGNGFVKNVAMDVVGHPNKENCMITLDSKIDNEYLSTFFDTYLTNVDVTTNQLKYIDSSYDTLTFGVDASTPLGVIGYAGSVGGKVKLYVGRTVLTGDTGNSSYVVEGIGNNPVAFQFIDGATITIPSTLIDSTVCTPTADITVLPTEYGKIVWLDEA